MMTFQRASMLKCHLQNPIPMRYPLPSRAWPEKLSMSLVKWVRQPQTRRFSGGSRSGRYKNDFFVPSKLSVIYGGEFLFDKLCEMVYKSHRVLLSRSALTCTPFKKSGNFFPDPSLHDRGCRVFLIFFSCDLRRHPLLDAALAKP